MDTIVSKKKTEIIVSMFFSIVPLSSYVTPLYHVPVYPYIIRLVTLDRSPGLQAWHIDPALTRTTPDANEPDRVRVQGLGFGV